MPNRIRSGIPAALAVLALAAPAAVAAPVTVNLRVEGATQTIFDAPVTTDGHDVTHRSPAAPTPATAPTDAGASRRRSDRRPRPSTTPPGSAASRWDGTGQRRLRRLLRQRVWRPDNATMTQFWGVLRELRSPSNVGGCQQRGRRTATRCSGPSTPSRRPRARARRARPARTTGAPVTVPVVDGADGSPEAGRERRAAAPTGADGKATLSFADAGIYRLKADRADSIRSNALVALRRPARRRPLHVDRQVRAQRGSAACRARSWPASAAARAPC